MKTIKTLSFCSLIFCACNSSFSSLETNSDPEIEALLARMSVEEKIGQMTQITADVITKGDNIYSSYEPFELDIARTEEAILQYHVGSVLNTANNRARTPKKWFEIINQLQELSVNKSSQKVPLIYGIDAIHGATYTAVATMFPQQIGQAATWNRQLVRRGAEATAYETRASSIPWNFSPVLDMGRNPNWPRMWETFGEAPYLTSALGVEMIKGYEGEQNDISDPQSVASCLKHYFGYGTPLSGKDRTTAHLTERLIREIHLPPFKAAIDAGAHSLMVNSGLINDIPVHANPVLLTQLLREELGFEGVIVSDWQDIENIYTRDKVAKDHKEAIKMGINAGIDMSMVPYKYQRFCNLLKELVAEGEVPMSRINDATRRILLLKKKLGLFEKPTTNYQDYPLFGSEEFKKDAYQTALESITLLKNDDNILPLDKSTRVLVTGPNANSMRALNGGWTYSWQGEKVEEFAQGFNTILEAVQKEIGDKKVSFVPGLEYKMDGKYYEEQNLNITAAVNAARRADVVLLCLGENTYTEKPGDLNDMDISTNQIALAKALAKTGKPVILILNEGRPRIISSFESEMKAVVQTYLPGNHGGDALANILFGDENPSGKLPYTYPKFANTIMNYDFKPSEQAAGQQGVYDYQSNVAIQYDFGHGFSYTTFSYSNLSLSSKNIDANTPLKISVDVTNSGARAGKEVVQLYISDLIASVSPANRLLKGFDKVSLESGETKSVSFEITLEDLAFWGRENKWTTEPGAFKVKIGNRETEFEYKGK